MWCRQTLIVSMAPHGHLACSTRDYMPLPSRLGHACSCIVTSANSKTFTGLTDCTSTVRIIRQLTWDSDEGFVGARLPTLSPADTPAAQQLPWWDMQQDLPARSHGRLSATHGAHRAQDIAPVSLHPQALLVKYDFTVARDATAQAQAVCCSSFHATWIYKVGNLPYGRIFHSGVVKTSHSRGLD